MGRIGQDPLTDRQFPGQRGGDNAGVCRHVQGGKQLVRMHRSRRHRPPNLSPGPSPRTEFEARSFPRGKGATRRGGRKPRVPGLGRPPGRDLVGPGLVGGSRKLPRGDGQTGRQDTGRHGEPGQCPCHRPRSARHPNIAATAAPLCGRRPHLDECGVGNGPPGVRHQELHCPPTGGPNLPQVPLRMDPPLRAPLVAARWL